MCPVDDSLVLSIQNVAKIKRNSMSLFFHFLNDYILKRLSFNKEVIC